MDSSPLNKRTCTEPLVHEVTVRLASGKVVAVPKSRDADKGILVADIKREVDRREGIFYGQQVASCGEEYDLADGRRLEGMGVEVSVVVYDVSLPEWDFSSPLIANKVFELGGEGSSIATKIDQHGSFKNCLWSNRVMEAGKHRTSLKLMKGEEGRLNHCFGLVRDGAAWDNDHTVRESTDAWYMENSGDLIGNGYYYYSACLPFRRGRIKEGQIVSMEADLDNYCSNPIRYLIVGEIGGNYPFP